jgi:hypothetical protein
MSKKIVSIIIILSLIIITLPISGLKNNGVLDLGITKPVEGGLYFFNLRLLTIPNIITRNYAQIFGMIDVMVDVESESGIKKVEFYVDNDFFSGFRHPELRSTDYEAPYEWLWNDFEFGKCLLIVVVYDNQLNSISQEIELIKIM